MFGRATAVSIALIIGFAAGTYFLLVPVSSTDSSHYQSLIAESAAIHSRSRVKSQPIEPFRKHVQKDVWTMHEGRPWHLSVKSETSLLSIQTANEKMDFREEAEKCAGWIFDGDTPYYISADQSKYENGELWLNGNVTIVHSGGEIQAEQAHLTEELFCLENQVKLKDHAIAKKESFALADEVLYRPLEQTFFLLSRKPKRVLFWQEGLSLSAPEVRIQRKSGTVEGIGDVHFTFDLEEKNAIQEIFEKFL